MINQGGKLTNVCAENSALSTPYSLSNTGKDAVYKEKNIPVDVNNCLTVENADSAIILISAATSYVDYKTISGDEKAKSKTPIDAASKKSFENLRTAHILDYQKFFNRVSLNFGTTRAADLPTDERIKNFAKGDDLQFAELYFQYGRYLLISSSRPNSQPATLQGLWNDSMTPPWDSKYTININTEMNYWLAEPTNLSELTEPLTKMVSEISETGRETAKTHYNAKGWVAHHNTDIWRATAPIDGAQWGIWTTGGAWLTTHLWEHYEYTQDRKYLEKIYPILKGSSEFFLDFLVKKPGTNYLVTSPSLSPENSHPFGTSVTDAPMMDSQIIRDLFSNTIKAGEILNQDAAFRENLKKTKELLPPNKIGKGGQLQEWFEDWDLEAKEQQHRHVSHLYAAFPSWQINKNDTPEFVEAVKKTLNTRGDITTGWAIACLRSRGMVCTGGFRLESGGCDGGLSMHHGDFSGYCRRYEPEFDRACSRCDVEGTSAADHCTQGDTLFRHSLGKHAQVGSERRSDSAGQSRFLSSPANGAGSGGLCRRSGIGSLEHRTFIDYSLG